MIILVDMDGVLANFEDGFLEHWQKKHPKKITIPVEERNTFYVSSQYPQEYSELIYEIHHSPGFFRNLKPINGGRQALQEMEDLGNDVFICTSPLSRYQNCVLEKYQWVEEHLGYEWTQKILLTRDKTLTVGDILIDDKPQITGIHTPLWEHIIYHQPYNQTEKCKRRLTWANWKNVLLFAPI